MRLTNFICIVHAGCGHNHKNSKEASEGTDGIALCEKKSVTSRKCEVKGRVYEVCMGQREGVVMERVGGE